MHQGKEGRCPHGHGSLRSGPVFESVSGRIHPAGRSGRATEGNPPSRCTGPVLSRIPGRVAGNRIKSGALPALVCSRSASGAGLPDAGPGMHPA